MRSVFYRASTFAHIPSGQAFKQFPLCCCGDAQRTSSRKSRAFFRPLPLLSLFLQEFSTYFSVSRLSRQRPFLSYISGARCACSAFVEGSLGRNINCSKGCPFVLLVTTIQQIPFVLLTSTRQEMLIINSALFCCFARWLHVMTGPHFTCGVKKKFSVRILRFSFLFKVRFHVLFQALLT